MAFTPDGSRVAACAYGRAWLLDASSMQAVKPLELSGRWLAITPYGREVIGAWKDEIRAISIADDSHRTVARPEQEVWKAALTPDGVHLVTASLDGPLEVWPVAKLTSGPRTISGDERGVGVAISPDGHHVVTASYRGWVTCWDFESGARHGRFHGEGAMSAIAISQDGQTVIAGEDIGRVHILRIQGSRASGTGAVN